MRISTRAQIVVGIAVAATVAVLGLTGCAARSGQTGADTSELGWDGQALEAIGFSTEDLAPLTLAGDPTPQASDKRHRDGARVKRLPSIFGRGLLHGEGVIQTSEGTKTVVVQRGTVTEISSTSMTVKSADGFTLTWTFGDALRVVKERKLAKIGDIAVGTEVGVSGAREASGVVARLVVVPIARPAVK